MENEFRHDSWTVDQCLDIGNLWFSYLKITLSNNNSMYRGCLLNIELYHMEQASDISFSYFPGAGDVWFSLSGTMYQNNSKVTLEDIGEGHDALFCKTNQTACCHPSYTGNGSSFGNWYFPNGTKVNNKLDFYRTRGHMVVRLNRRRGGVEGIYRCVIPDSMNVKQTIYIGVYTASTGE